MLFGSPGAFILPPWGTSVSDLLSDGPWTGVAPGTMSNCGKFFCLTTKGIFPTTLSIVMLRTVRMEINIEKIQELI